MRFTNLKIAGTIFSLCACAQVNAQGLPSNGPVVSGNATLSLNGQKLTVTNIPGAAINWQSFSIGTGNVIQFIQPSASSLVLNRVTGSTPSTILGAMVSSGKVFTVNPNGATVGGSTAVNAAALIPSIPTNTFQVITSDGAHTLRSLPPPPSAATQAVMGADGVIRLTAAKP
jgi:filamentous hemagglutinin family protein